MKNKLIFLAVVLMAHTAFSRAQAAEPVEFIHQIKPILEMSCLSCHNPERPRGNLRLDTREWAIKGGDYGPSLVPGDPQESTLYSSTILPADHADLMPPAQDGGPLPKEQTELLRLWIEQGAHWPEEIVLKQVQTIEFVRDIQPILEFNCVSCHNAAQPKGGLRLDNKADAFKGGDTALAIIPGRSSASLLYTSTILPEDHADIMPPLPQGGPLDRKLTDLLRHWIDQGASWPDELELVARRMEEEGLDELPLVMEIHDQILQNTTVTTEAGMEPYTVQIPGTRVSFDMVPIPGGEFLMGSPESEAGRRPDEGPQIRVRIDPFWMGKHEITWEEYELFMYPREERRMREMLGYQTSPFDVVADASTRPTAPYVEMSFGMGKDGYPAICMTQHAANKYCQWLSAKTGHFYRLPTEAEWEYAARAGAATAYSFGDDPSLLDDYAWHEDNSDWKYQPVGRKKPNPWGLHDMHGNVAEWVLDQYDPDFYKQFVGNVVANPWNRATQPYPHSVRGGSWDHPPEMLRSAARLYSDPSWKLQDPQLPKSIWWHTDAHFLGFRIVRPLEVPPPEEMHKYWTSGVEKD